MIHVCSLELLSRTIEDTGARHLVTLLKDTSRVQRPAVVPEAQHLVLSMDDIACEMDGFVHPCDDHLTRLIDFVQLWDRTTPIAIHCFAGISRSTAAAFVAACAINPARSEDAIARAIRDASHTATPNARIVALADAILQRDGRMIRAVEAIGSGTIAGTGHPFRLDLE